MKKNILLSLSLVAAMMLMATTACAHTTPSKQDAIEMAAPDEETNIQVDTIEVMSQAMGRPIKNVVVMPKKYFGKHVAAEGDHAETGDGYKDCFVHVLRRNTGHFDQDAAVFFTKLVEMRQQMAERRLSAA